VQTRHPVLCPPWPLGVLQLLVTLRCALPCRLRVVDPAQTPECLAAPGQGFGPLALAVSRQQRERGLDQAKDLLERAHRQGILGGVAEEGGSPRRVGGRTCLVQVIADLSRPLAGTLAVDALEGVGDGEGIRLQPRQGNPPAPPLSHYGGR